MVGGVLTKLANLPLVGQYEHPEGEENEEYVVPVEWINTLDRSSAIWEKGYFANQNSACKFRNRFTLDGLARHFKLDD